MQHAYSMDAVCGVGTWTCGACPAGYRIKTAGVDCADAAVNARLPERCQLCVGRQWFMCTHMENSFGEHELTHALQKARGVHLNSTGRERETTAWSSTVMLTVANAEVQGLLENLLCSLRQLQFKVAVATLDDATAEWLAERKVRRARA